MALPVLDSTFEISDCQHILGSSLSFIDLVCNAFGRCASFLKFAIVWVVGGRRSFQKRLTKV